MWGAATSSTQIEGAYDEDGKCLSVWDVATEKQIENGENCHVACDHYHRYKEDIALMKELGLKSYRFSVNWCRIFPEEGKVNQKGLDFYLDLVRELKAAGIEPLCTLYHWDLPVWVQERGGWKNRKIADWFAEYVKTVVEALSEHVVYWFTLNEPQIFVLLGYVAGSHAPFKHNFMSIKKLTQNTLLAHWRAVNTIRLYAKQSPKIGIATASSCYVPHDETSAEIERARKKTFEEMAGLSNNRWWLDPILAKKSSRFFGTTRISQKFVNDYYAPIDFIGINVYQPYNYEGYGRNSDPLPKDTEKTMLNWVVDGRCLYWVTRFVYERYGLPVLISENGMAARDTVSEDDAVHDVQRVGFLKKYLSHLKRAVDEGLPVFGYQHWSLLDNFEWGGGYSPRFGLIHVDYKTQKRTMKDSAKYYAEIIRTNGENL